MAFHFRAEGAACTPAPWRFLERFDAQGIGAGIPSRCSYPTNGNLAPRLSNRAGTRD
jgi:hypothetical protein